MATEEYIDADADGYIEEFTVSTNSATSIDLAWQVAAKSVDNVANYRVYYQQVASSYIQYTDFLSRERRQYTIADLTKDTYYRVCLIVYKNDSGVPMRECHDASTVNWQIPVSIGSSIGAVLALVIIILLVLVANCSSVKRRRRRCRKNDAATPATENESAYYDGMSSRADHYEMSESAFGMYNDDDMFSECDPSTFDTSQSSALMNSHASSSDAQNFARPQHTHVLHVHAFRTPTNSQSSSHVLPVPDSRALSSNALPLI